MGKTMKKPSIAKKKTHWTNAQVAPIKKGKLAVLCTDTIFGIIGLALNEQAVRRIYRVKKRNPKKPFIILVSSMKDLEVFGVHLSHSEKAALRTFWPGPVSILFPIRKIQSLRYLHRGTKSLIFRLPRDQRIRNLLRKTGPLVAPSANPEGLPPAQNIAEAKTYFGTSIDLYLEGGKPRKKPSKILQFNHGAFDVIRA